MNDVHMDEAEFVGLATRILEAKGTPATSFGSKGKQSLRYEDHIVIIVSNYNGLSLEIERKAQPLSEQRHLIVSNPVTMVDSDGKIIRHHGEHAHIAAHLIAVANDWQATTRRERSEPTRITLAMASLGAKDYERLKAIKPKMIRCIDATASEYVESSDLTKDQTYVVLAESDYRYQIKDDTNEIFWHHKDRFIELTD